MEVVQEEYVTDVNGYDDFIFTGKNLKLMFGDGKNFPESARSGTPDFRLEVAVSLCRMGIKPQMTYSSSASRSSKLITSYALAAMVSQKDPKHVRLTHNVYVATPPIFLVFFTDTKKNRNIVFIIITNVKSQRNSISCYLLQHYSSIILTA